MNHRYLAFASLLIAGASAAQNSRAVRETFQFAEEGTPQQIPAHSNQRDGGDVIFSEDFANGFAGNNGFGAWTTSGPNGNIWKRSLTGPVGSYSVATQIIASTSVANGFAAFFSDSANCSCSSGTANWPANPIEWDGALESPLLDLSATPSVMLQWEQRLRWCCQATSPHAIEVSTDGGATWPTTLEAASGIATNNDPGTQVRQVMLTSAIAADPSQVKFRFKHNPTAAAYHWQIDDVQLIELFSDDMKLDYSFFSHTGNGEEYGRIPMNQLNSTMLIGGDVVNNGAQQQTNVTVTADVQGPVPFSTAINGGSVDPGASVTIQEDYALPGLTEGLYEGSFTVSADNPDQVADNNDYLRNFEVNNAVYSVDGIGNHPAGYESLSSIGTPSFTDGEDGLVLLNYYEISSEVMVYGLEIGLTSSTVAGGYVVVNMRDTTPVFEAPPNMNSVLAESDPIDITAPMITAGKVGICFLNPVTLSPNGYFASVTLYSNAGVNDIRVVDDLTVPQPGITSAIYIPNDDVYSNGNAYYIRLLLTDNACTVGVPEVSELDGVSMTYNQASNVVNIAISEPGKYTVEVIDALGQVVGSTSTGGSTTLNLSNHADGVYLVRVSSDKGRSIQRFTVE